MTRLRITGATLVAAPGRAPQGPVSLISRGGRIVSIGPEDPSADEGSDLRTGEPGEQVLDVGGRVVIAGYWNSHVHLTERVWAHAGSAPAQQLQPELDDMFLARGFTTAVDLGSDPRSTGALRRRIEHEELAGPRLLIAGMGLYPPRGLPFYVRQDLPWYLRPLLPQPRTGAGARRALRRSHRHGAEVAKLFTGSYVELDRITPMPLPVARAAVQQAHRQGRLVFAHPSNLEGTRVALEAGVDILAHVPDSPEGTAPLLREAAEQGCSLVPTLDMFAQTGSRDPAYLGGIYDGLKIFVEAGGRVLFGTDVGYLPDRDIRGELEALATCGLDVEQVLAMLTAAPASVFSDVPGVGSSTVAEGEAADLVVLDHRELTHPGQLADVHTTIRGGQVLWSAR